jgi:hypothetical protein
MPHILFDGSDLKLENYFSQSGGGIISHYEAPNPYQRGYGHFSALARQRGAGVGSVVRHIWRYLRPMISSAAPITASIGKAVGKEALATTARVLGDVAAGKADVGESFATQSREGVNKLLKQASAKLEQKGSGRGRKRRRIRRGRVIIKPELLGQSVPIRANLKRKRADSLGYY